MSRIFLSHSSVDEREAVAVNKWLSDNGWNDVFLDIDPQRGLVAGERWQEALRQAADRCEAVIFIVSPAWAKSKWCQADILRNCCDPIDAAGGNYDATGHSTFYGYGRLNARKAVELARPPQPTAVAIRTAQQDVPIHDLKTSRLRLAIADTQPIKSLKVTVDIDHTYIGDLEVTLEAPKSVSAKRAMLHDRKEGSAHNLKRTYDVVNAPDLARYLNTSPAGTWTLQLADKEKADTGTIRSFTLEMGF
jgi:subtilisin-like proprotein convertase family protein